MSGKVKVRNEKSRGFASGVSILAVSALLVKVIGLCYRIPLLGYLGTEGMGYFNTAYELYALFCVISTAGLPVAMSVLISGSLSDGRGGAVKRIFCVSLLAFVCIGAVGSVLLFGLAEPLAAFLKNDEAAACIRMISPTVFFICLSSAYRGYFQGRRDMTPTAVSQVIEAAGKLFLGLLFASVAVARGAALPMVAASAALGLTVGTAVSVLYLWTRKLISDHRHPLLPREGEERERGVLSRLLYTAVPITLSAGVISLTKCIDLALILRRLQTAGMSTAEANSLYGCYSTLAVPVFNMLPSLATSVALSAVPALAAALGRGKDGEGEVARVSLDALRMSLYVSIPAALGLAVFSGDILGLLFGSQPDAVAMASPWLSCLALSVPASCLITVTGAMLQAAGRADRPVISMLLGAGAKTALAYVLIGIPSVGLMGAPISTLLCDTVIVISNLVFLARHAPTMLPNVRQSVGLLLLPTAAATLAVGAVYIARRTFGWGEISPIRSVGVVVMVACLYGAIMLPRLIIEKQNKG